MSKLGSWGDILRFEVRGDGNRILQPLETEETYSPSGSSEYLILGGRRVSEGRMYIKSLRIRRERTMKRGELADATASITFRRYT